MIHLVIKGDADDARAACDKRGISIFKIVSILESHCVIAEAENASEYDVVRWFCEEETPIIMELGYAPGALLRYSFRN